MRTEKKRKKRISPWVWLLTAVAVILLLVNSIAILYLLSRNRLENTDTTVPSTQQTHQSQQVQLSGGVFDMDAEEIVLSGLTAEDIPMFARFHDLRRIDATAIREYGLIQELIQAIPECAVQWQIALGETTYDPAAGTLDLTGIGIGAEKLLTELNWFAELKQVNLTDATYSPEQKGQLRTAYPQIIFCWPVEAAGKTWLSTDAQLSYAGETADATHLAAAGDGFYGVEDLDLTGCGLSVEELLAIQEAFPEARIHSELTAFGMDFTTDAETLDFSGIHMENLTEVENILPLMHNLSYVDMCDCGISNEEMHELNQRYEDIQIVWKVYFSVYSLRTDATFFCASDLPWNDYVAIKMTDEQLEPIRYCTELIALDLGHMRYTDLSFLENMPKLEYLILVEAQFHDITPIGTLKNLKYLELFVNTIDDLSPLLNCTELRHLNIGYTSGFDPSVLKEMTYLERLWYPGNKMTDEEIQSMIDALPHTKCHMPVGDPQGSTGAGWREADIYFEMRNIFSMHYMPGGTGMNPKN